MKFTYKATKEGKTVNGSMEAGSREAVLSALVKQGLRPLIITVAHEKARFNPLGRQRKIKLQTLVIFTRQLSTMITAGVPLARGLATLQNNPDPYFRTILASISKDVEGGLPLGDAFAKYPAVFSDVYVNMVRAGEEGGILDEILKRLAVQVEQDASIRKKVKGAMMYPTVILSMTVVAFFGIMFFIMPKIGKIITDLGGPNAKLPIYTQVLLSFSDFCKSTSIIRHVPLFGIIPIIKLIPNLIFVMLLLAIAAFYLLRYIRTPTGKYRFHSLVLKTPILKTIIIKVAIARFSRTFASLMGAGVGVLDALEVTGGAMGNKVIERELQAAAEAVKNGRSLSEQLRNSPHFPQIVPEMLAVGEETGQIDTVLIKVADFYEEEVKTTIDSLTSIIEPVMIVVIGSGVGVIAASVMGPIASLSKNITPNS